MNIAQVIENHPASDIALVGEGESVTYGELQQRASALRTALRARGIGAGDRVLVIGENEIEFVLATIAVLGIGAHVAPIRSRNPLPEVQRKAAAIDPQLVLMAATAAWVTEHSEHVVGADFAMVAELESGPYSENRASEVLSPVYDGDLDDLAFLLLTSGVSGDAKVAMLSHGNLNWVQSLLSENEAVGLTSDDVALCILPLTHIFGLNVILLTTLRVGGTVVLEAEFSVDESLRLIREQKVTTISGVPRVWQAFVESDAPADTFANVRQLASGAAALPGTLFAAFQERFGAELAEGYGLTETSPIVTWSRGIKTKPGSVGHPVPGVEVILVEDDGTAVEPGDAGEIVIRSPGVFKGYLDDPELTSTVLTEDGWFWTGDVGVFDADGYLYLVDRIKDIIIVSGFNVYPSEVESILLSHPKVQGAIVVGTPHARTGEAVVAHISGEATVEELEEHCRANLSRYKWPSEYRLVDELPVSATGKPLRRVLR